VAAHLKRYWEPRMRAQMIAYYEQRQGAGLTDLAKNAVALMAAESKARRCQRRSAGRQGMRPGEPDKALICGSLAFGHHHGVRRSLRQAHPADKIHMLNVSFLVPQLRREFGGCAGNIAYNLGLLVTSPIHGHRGRDFGPYREWLARAGVPADHVRVIDAELTAQAFITTDLDDNQITAFHPGAMQHAHENRVSDASDIAIGIVAPDGARA